MDDLVDFAFRAHVDAARRLVEDQHFRLDGQPARQQDFLLVAARQAADDAFRPRYLDVQAGNRFARQPGQRAAVDHAGRRVLRQDIHRHVFHRRQLHEQAQALAVFRQIADAVADRRQRFADMDFLAVQPDLARCLFIGAKDQPRQLRAARADQSGQARHFARMQHEAGRLDLAGADVFHAQTLGAARGAPLVRIKIVCGAAHHHLHDFLLVQLILAQFAHIGAVAQHRDAARQALDFGHAVADIQDRQALVALFLDNAEQLFGFAVGQCRRRFIHDQDAAFVHEGAGDFHLLLLGDRQAGHHGVGIEARAQVGQDGIGAAAHLGAVDGEERSLGLAAHEDVLRHRHVLGHAQFLVDQVDAQRARLARIADFDRFAVENDLARVRRVHARQDFHQGTLAGAVFAHHGMDLALAHRQVHAAQRARGAKALLDAAHFKNDFVAHDCPSLL